MLVTSLAAILTLAAAAAPASMDGVASVEHVLLPPPAGRIAVRVEALDRAVIIDAPRDAAAVARAVRRAPRAVCTGVAEGPGQVRLSCRSNRIVARLSPREGGLMLDVREVRGVPWGGDTAAPLVPFEPPDVGLGAACPGSTPEGRAECLIAAHDLAGARTELAGGHGGAAELRLGDLAYAEGDTRAAATHWARARGQPWERLAAPRLCELDAACAAGPHAEALYAAADLPRSVERDLVLRRARALAFLERPLEAARLLLGGAAGRGACAEATPLCRRIALAALREPDPAGAEALALWLEMPDRDRGLYELEVATSRGAERAGAPLFAAAVLAGAVGLARQEALPEHLLHTAELYAEGGDRVRAGVVYDFARARAGARGLAGARWAAVAKAIGARTKAVAVRNGKAKASAKATSTPTATATSTSTSTATPTATWTSNPTTASDDAALLAAAERVAARARREAEGGRP
jgi:hypothetical protein